ncbi:hypothetical protein KJ865_15755 [Myxococcota bacterium]|nr:hypothetical protein [Myxococcota bacterium]
MRGGTPYMERGITEENFWFFTQRRDKKQKTRRHFTRRFSITRQRYRSLHAAHRAFTLRYEKYSQSSPMETKGDVSFTILTGTSVYLISADCLMGNHLTAVFTMFTRTVLAGHDPEPGSLLKHMCGGTFRLL